MIVVGAPGDPLAVLPGQLIGGDRSIRGHASGTSIDSQDTLAFSDRTGVRPMIETVPLENAAEAYDRMIGNEARFRMVLLTGT
jgi:D-arabinose 1-dehydrogenase-like Zn-dependent alcohol dehydrogenase